MGKENSNPWRDKIRTPRRIQDLIDEDPDDGKPRTERRKKAVAKKVIYDRKNK